MLLLNRMDRLDEAGRAALLAGHPEANFLSASSDNVAALRATILAFFESAMVEDRLRLLYVEQSQLGTVSEIVRVASETFNPDGRILHLCGLPGGIARLRRDPLGFLGGGCSWWCPVAIDGGRSWDGAAIRSIATSRPDPRSSGARPFSPKREPRPSMSFWAAYRSGASVSAN